MSILVRCLGTETLEKLPGVGRKTANVVLNIAFGEPTIAVDTHLFRISNRTGLAKGKTPLAVEKKLEKVTPQEFGDMPIIGSFSMDAMCAKRANRTV